MKSVYIDCNILIDWLLDREPFSSFSARLIELIETKKVNGYVSPLTIANTYYIISKEINKKIAYEFVYDCLKIFTITEINRQNIEEAIEYKFKDFEDDLHISIAHQLNIDHVITRNKKDFVSDKFQIVDAEEFIKIYENEI